MTHPLNHVLNPRSVAIIGASEVPGKAGERRTRSLLESRFSGNIYPVNPKRDQIFGLKAYPNILDIDGEADLVMIVVPARFIPDAVAGSIQKGAKGIVIITAGLGESGSEGKAIEAEILEMAKEAGVYIIGPNCSGMFSAGVSMNILGIPGITKGHMAVLAQSGNIIDSLTHYAKLKGGGFSRIISAGNAIGVKLHEYIAYLGQDPDTKVIAMYLEGIREGNAFVRVARKVTKIKPIVALKVGRTGAGARAAASHTGSLAGDDAMVEAAFHQAGIVRVSNPDELFDVANVFQSCPPSRGRRLVILSEGGGDNSVAADNAERYGLEVPVLSQTTQESIRPFLLKGMPASNPIDYGGTAEENPHMITECCKLCMADDAVDGLLITGFFGGFRDIIAPHVAEIEEQTAKELAKLVEQYNKPLVINSSFAAADYPTFDILKENAIPVFDGPERAVHCMSALMHYYDSNKDRRIQPEPSNDVDIQPEAVQIIESSLKQNRSSLLEPEGIRLLKTYGLPVLPGELAKTEEDAVWIASRIGFPVVLKIVSQDILHKSDMGGVKVNLVNEADVRKAFSDIMRKAKSVTTPDRIDGVLVVPMAAKGLECIVGMITDPIFGPVIMFGLGGIFVEVLKDVSFRIAPLTTEDIDDMIKETKGYRMLTGVRGETPRDISAIRQTIRQLAHLSLCHSEIKEIDLNPVIVHEKGLSIADCRVILAS
jgi:acetyltransferase